MKQSKGIPPFLLIVYLGMMFGIIACALSDMTYVAWVVFPLLFVGGFLVGKSGPEREYS
jgi:hypothetical protein